MVVESMSDAAGQQHEPSMEEILASIRRIIAEDGDPAAATPQAAAPPAAKPAAKPAHEPAPEEILELTEVVEADTLAPPPPAPPAPAPVVPLVQPRPPEPAPRMTEDTPPGDSIVSAATAAASVAALSQITALQSRGEPRGDIGLGAGHLTLEMIVREELRPILKDWLDRNLPEMVQRLVSLEIARLVGDVQRR
jgi:cell pole-organizing protein PopZ